MKIQALHKKGVWIHVMGLLLKLSEFSEKTVVTEVKQGRKVISRVTEAQPVENPFAVLINPVDILALRAAGEDVNDKTPGGVRGVFGHIWSEAKGHFTDELEKDGGTFALIEGKKVPFTLEAGFTNVDADGNVKISPKTGKPMNPRGKFGTPAGEGVPVVWNGVEGKLVITITQRPGVNGGPSNGVNIFASLNPKGEKRTAYKRDESSLVQLDGIANLFAEI